MAHKYYGSFTNEKIRRFCARILGDLTIWNDLQVVAAALFDGLTVAEWEEAHCVIFGEYPVLED